MALFTLAFQKIMMAQHSKEYRFVVRSAQEAVEQIQQRLGDQARVTSVRPLKQGALGGLFRAPKLEVLATLQEAEADPHQSVPDPSPTVTTNGSLFDHPVKSKDFENSRPYDKGSTIHEGSGLSSDVPKEAAQHPFYSFTKNARAGHYDESSEALQSESAAHKDATAKNHKDLQLPHEASPRLHDYHADSPSITKASSDLEGALSHPEKGRSSPSSSGSISAVSNPIPFADEEALAYANQEQLPASNATSRSSEEKLLAVLRKTALPEKLIQALRFSPQWGCLIRLPLIKAFASIGHWLRQEYRNRPQRALSQRIAFIGSPGSGKTTSLCKWLTHTAFMDKKKVCVLQLEGDQSNLSDILSPFCQLLRIPLIRRFKDYQADDPEHILLVDCPGVYLHTKTELSKLNQSLESMGIDTRILTLNAAYNERLIESAFTLGTHLGATHFVMTHCDALIHYSPLWRFAIHSDLSPLFFSYGQNLTGAFTQDVLNYLISKTFPHFS